MLMVRDLNTALQNLSQPILPTPERVIKATTIQAAITHNTPDGINAAIAAALMSHYFIYQLGTKDREINN